MVWQLGYVWITRSGAENNPLVSVSKECFLYILSYTLSKVFILCPQTDRQTYEYAGAISCYTCVHAHRVISAVQLFSLDIRYIYVTSVTVTLPSGRSLTQRLVQ